MSKISLCQQLGEWDWPDSSTIDINLLKLVGHINYLWVEINKIKFYNYFKKKHK